MNWKRIDIPDRLKQISKPFLVKGEYHFSPILLAFYNREKDHFKVIDTSYGGCEVDIIKNPRKDQFAYYMILTNPRSKKRGPKKQILLDESCPDNCPANCKCMEVDETIPLGKPEKY